jgi:hypothetical protein
VNVVLTVPTGTRVMSALNGTLIPTQNRGAVAASSLVPGDCVNTADGVCLTVASVTPAEEA